MSIREYYPDEKPYKLVYVEEPIRTNNLKVTLTAISLLTRKEHIKIA